MSILHSVSDRVSLRAPLRSYGGWTIVLNLIASILEAIQEAADMRRVARQEYPFYQE